VALYRYRAATAAGELKAGVLEGGNQSSVIASLRRQGLVPIEAVETKSRKGVPDEDKPSAAARRAVINSIGEIAVLLGAGLTLDRALAICVENTARPDLKGHLSKLRERVKEGIPLAQAMSEARGLFSPMACAMAEAGEASGKLDISLARLAAALERADVLRQTIVSALVYPTLLLVVAAGVILVMLLVVVPQFENLFAEAPDKVPLATKIVISISHAARTYGLYVLLGIGAALLAAMRWAKSGPARLYVDRAILKTPHIGAVVRDIETARFARTLGSLVESGVALPNALAISERAIVNQHMARAVAHVAVGLKEGGGLSAPLAAAGVFGPMAMSFLRTGEETAQLGHMLHRLADVLERDVRTAVERSIAIFTPVITVVMGMIVAGVIASVMTAILGFNDLALG